MPTKLETLNASLEAAKQALDEASARLKPQIAAEQARVDGLREAHNKVRRDQEKAHARYQKARLEVGARLFPAEVFKQLRAALKAHVGEKFPHADIERLARDYEASKVSVDPEVVAALAAFKELHTTEENTRRVFYVATTRSSKLCKLQDELYVFRDRVFNLQKEVDRLPRYRQAAKERREQERQEALSDEQTQGARDLMADFNF